MLERQIKREKVNANRSIRWSKIRGGISNPWEKYLLLCNFPTDLDVEWAQLRFVPKSRRD